MSDVPERIKNQQHDAMTVDRLRQHLFGAPQVPFWNYDPAQITVGLEIEYFIAKVDDHGAFTLATKIEYQKVMGKLKADFGYLDLNLSDQPGRISRNTEIGFIAIKPDFAWHILEISFPPRRSLGELKSLMQATFFEIDLALGSFGLCRLDRSALPDVPRGMELVKLNRLFGISETFMSPSSGLLVESNFPALITATHVHLNACSEPALSFLPELFKSDGFISSKFTRPTLFKGKTYQDLRSELYRNGLGQNYLLHTTPDPVPSDLQAICDLMNRSAPLFPNDPFFPVRNMCSIRPSRFGTFEFRSTCSFLDTQIILEIVKWRIAQLLTAYQMEPYDTKFEESLEDKVNVLRNEPRGRK